MYLPSVFCKPSRQVADPLSLDSARFDLACEEMCCDLVSLCIEEAVDCETAAVMPGTQNRIASGELYGGVIQTVDH